VRCERSMSPSTWSPAPALARRSACSMGAGQIERAAAEFLAFDWRNVAVLLDPVFPRAGLIDGRKVAEFLRARVGSRTFAELQLPLRVVASDLRTGG